MNFFNGIYTLQEIAIHNNLTDNEIRSITKMSQKEELNKIVNRFPLFKKFLPYCEPYIKDGKNFYAIPAYIYDTYMNTGFLLNLDIYDEESDVDKKEYWKYKVPIYLNIKPQENWDFANDLFSKLKGEDLWKLFLAGNARMNYYQDENVSIDQRIKYAIVEYMLKRPQFFTTDDFIDNPILHKKYSKK